LLEMGFTYSYYSNPSHVDMYDKDSKERKLTDLEPHQDVYLVRYVSCNQDDIIYQLLKAKIPFVGLCHYEQELVFWDGKTPGFYIGPNLVELVSQHLDKPVYDSVNTVMEKHNIKAWLKKEEKLWGSNES